MKKLYLGCLFTFLCVGVSFAQQEKISFEVYFKLAKADLKQESIDKIDSVWTASSDRIIHTRVSGHTCDWGGDDYNMTLSEDRAKEAFEYAKTKGMGDDKLELFFYGEKDAKYPNEGGDRPLNRRVEITFTLEDDDRDTVVRDGCSEVFIEKGTYQPKKNKEATFEIRNINTAAKVKNENILMEDKNGRKLYATGIMYFNVSVNGEELSPSKNLKLKIPAVGEPKEGYTLYRGEKNGSGQTIWVNTGKACEAQETSAECKTYDFEWQFSGYCGCLKPRDCEEDCHENPFGGEEYPKNDEADIRYSGADTKVRFPDGSYPKDLEDLQVTVVDDMNLDEDLDICEHFEYGVTTDEVFPTYYNVKALQNIIVKAKDGSNSVESDANKTQKIYVPKDRLKDMENPIIIPGIRHSKGYIKWDVAKYEQSTCLGSVNCKYVVFEVPGTGNYKLGEWSDAAKPEMPDKYVLKTRVLKDNIVYVGDTKRNYVYKSKNHERNGKKQPKEYSIKDYEAVGSAVGDQVVLVKHTKKNGKKFYQEAKLADLKFKSKKNMYIMRRRDFTKIDDFANMELGKCK